jgi:uncharacterized DUF497 family protein
VYEWDEAKREANLRKHRLDFLAAHLVYESPKKVTYRERTEPEARFKDVALVEVKGSVLALVYTISQRECPIHLVPLCISQGKETLCRCQIVT